MKLSARVTIALTAADYGQLKQVVGKGRLSEYLRNAVMQRVSRDVARLHRPAV